MVKYERGDKVTVSGTVDSPGFEDYVCVCFNGDDRSFSVPKKAIVTYEKRPIQVGDEVTVSGVRDYKVISIHGEYAWLSHAETQPFTAKLSSLSRWHDL